MKAVVMAGGEGSRLRPLTCELPKPMVPVMNRPLMEYTLDLLKLHGIKEVAVTLQYLPEQIRDYFGDGSRYGLNMMYFIEDEPLGTAGSVKNAASFLDETFIVISGDALTDIDLTRALEFHKMKGAIATLVLTPVDTPLEYGIIITSPDGRITRFVEKPGWGEVFSDTVNTGIYILEPEALNYFAQGQKFDFSKDLFPLLMEQGEPMYGHLTTRYWCDIGNISQYAQAHWDIMKGKIAIELRAREVERGIWMEEDVDVHPQVILQAPVYVGSGSYLGHRAIINESVLGSENCIEVQASSKRGITWRGACLEKKSALRGAILCRSVRLAPRTSVFEGAVIGDNSILEENVVIKPDVKIWPDKRVESGAVVRENIIWGTRVASKLFGADSVIGEVNREISPEFAVKLGAAYGASLNKGTVVLSSDHHKASRMLKQCLTAGLASVGLIVYDMGESLTSVTRNLILELKAEGAVHVRLTDVEPTIVRLKFMDNQGLNLSRNHERKIEQLFCREDFPRVSGLDVGEEVKLPDLLPYYKRKLLQRIDLDPVRRAGFRVVIGYPDHFLQSVLNSLLQEMHCRMLVLNSNIPFETNSLSLKKLRERRHEVASTVRNHSATMGVIIDPGAEEMLLIDDSGRLIEGELYKALIQLLLFRMQRGGTVAVPVTASHVIETIAGRYKGKVLRTRTSTRHHMEEVIREESKALSTCSPFSLNFDCLAVLVHLLEFLAVQEIVLSTLLSEIPEIHLLEREIPCPWGQKGKIMRRLIEESPSDRMEMLDGLKVYHPEGWALVLPDPDKPSYHVFGEGFNQEISTSLADIYVNKICELQREK